MKRLLAAAVLLALVGSCRLEVGDSNQVRRLPSGKQIRVLSVDPMQFNGDTALNFRYITELSVDNERPALIAEANEIWSAFHSEADQRRLATAVLSAIEKEETSTKGAVFVFQKKEDGSWRLLVGPVGH